jgi:glycosyltransferase involved in cell wall biosynthesis
MPRVSAVIRCADAVGSIHVSVESVLRQSLGQVEVILVTDATTPERAHDWLRAYARSRSSSLVQTSAVSPGASWNAGVRGGTAPCIVCLDAGELLDPRYLELACRHLDDAPELDAVSSGVRFLGPEAEHADYVPDAFDVETIVARLDAIHGASALRRQTWVDLGGFDEVLPALAETDLWLRALGLGRRGAVIPSPLLIRPLGENTLYRRAWDADRHGPAVQALVARHREAFGRHVGVALYQRELRLQHLTRQNQARMARHEAGQRELDSLRARIEELRGKVPTEAWDSIDLGDLRRVTPVSHHRGSDRGTPIDRYYVEQFLSRHAGDVRGSVLEAQDGVYTQRFGGDRVTQADVVDLDVANARATVVSDLCAADNIPSDTYDCVVFTQTPHIIDHLRAAVSHCARILKPGGVLLVTLPCVSRTGFRPEHDSVFWSASEAGAWRLFSEFFPADGLTVLSRGNVLANTAFLYGLACHDLSPEELEADDPGHPMLVTIRAVKAGGASS